jgi:tetratricopeptide (TPR) repeat protein
VRFTVGHWGRMTGNGTLHGSGQKAALLGILATALVLNAWSLPARADTRSEAAPAGVYLSARAARQAADLTAASDLFAQALESDPADPWLLGNALSADLGLGRIEAAADLADRIVEAGLASPFAHLVLTVSNARDGDWRAVLSNLEAGRKVGPLVDGLARGYAWLGLGDDAAALSAFDELAANPDFRAFGLYHKAVALAQSGDLAGSEALFSGPEAEGVQRTRRSILAQAQVLGALGRSDDAVALLDESFGSDLDAPLAALRARLATGEIIPFDLVRSPEEGLAEVYFSVAAVLVESDPEAGLLYARAALALNERHAEAALLTAELFQTLGQPVLAREAYGLVPPDNPVFVAAELGRAEVLRDTGEEEAALEVLTGLAQDRPDLADVEVGRGDLLRGLERHEEAEAAYSRAIDLSSQDSGRLWLVHFMRALAREAQGDWPGAEADLRRSLELRPDQPQVLNHLGYSLVDRGEKLDEALALIGQAVDLHPNNGAIVDSLGWAYFRLGRYAEAVEQLEKAATLEANDPVVNDHLGDAYWRVDRIREARFQWKRALSLDPAPADVERIREKLASGLAEATDAAATKETAGLPAGSQGG